jgi:hypothetical protein
MGLAKKFIGIIFMQSAEGTVKSFSDGAVKSSRSRLAQFRRMQGTWPYVKL